MKHLTLKALSVAAALLMSASGAMAAVVAVNPGADVTVDGQTFRVDARQFFDQRLQKTIYLIEGFTDLGRGIQGIDSFMDPDPVITSAVSVLDFGPSSNFNISWSLPIVPTVGPVTLKLTLGGSCTDNDRNGCSATPNLASGFLADGLLDGLVKISGGSVFSGPAGGSGSFASSVFTVNLPAGPYSNLGLGLGFQASGGGDAVSFTLGVEVVNATVAEPASLALSALAIGMAGLASRRRSAA